MEYYDTLGVSKSDTAAQIKKAYKKLALQCHPDRPGGDEAKFRTTGKKSTKTPRYLFRPLCRLQGFISRMHKETGHTTQPLLCAV